MEANRRGAGFKRTLGPILAGVLLAAGQGHPASAVRAPAPQPRCTGRWTVVPSVNVGSDSNVLTGAWAASSDDVWAVGYYGDQRFDASETLAQHWDGSRWSLVPTPVPGPGPGGNFFNGISGTSGDDVWAVGDYATGLPLVLNLIEHWDGSEWSVVPSPNNGSGSNLLEAVSAVSPTDAWAVGFYVDGFGDHDLIEHWDGSAWTIVRAPQYQGEPVLYGVAFRSVDDGWAVGWKDGVDQEEKDTLVEHWDGVGWSASGAVDPGFQTPHVLTATLHFGERRDRGGAGIALSGSDQDPGRDVGRGRLGPRPKSESGERVQQPGGRVGRCLVGPGLGSGELLRRTHQRIPNVDRAMGRDEVEGRLCPEPQ